MGTSPWPPSRRGTPRTLVPAVRRARRRRRPRHPLRRVGRRRRRRRLRLRDGIGRECLARCCRTVRPIGRRWPAGGLVRVWLYFLRVALILMASSLGGARGGGATGGLFRQLFFFLLFHGHRPVEANGNRF